MKFAGLTLAYWTVLVAALLPILCATLAKWGALSKPRREGGYDNHHPRAWLAQQTDWRARANAAQANSFEALPFYIGAVIIAHQLGVFQTRLDLLAFLYIVLRLMYILFYLADMATFRSVVWTAALALNIAILFL
ncbi:MAPEG family protein [Hydrogenophaga sp. A37]|uniref:MAPEG family protein n=1 Tax=Hydrogenophaga sp. A37 TaxID=1945864 RepID=UPI0009846711|nr:MAPEG family protein [Hydrogenophaga sp. A37]OOG79535.1 glutathione metabolism protein [Hydrogenophaga sp. A37]